MVGLLTTKGSHGRVALGQCDQIIGGDLWLENHD